MATDRARLQAAIAMACLALLCVLLIGQSHGAGGVRLDPIAGAPAAGDFELPAPDGTSHRLSDYRGRLVMVNFWATWCRPCREEMPAMQRLYDQLRTEGLEILAVHAGDEPDKLARFLGEVVVDFPVLIDADLALAHWGITGLPTTVFVDRQGRMILRAIGPRDWDRAAMIDQLRELL